MSDVIICGTGFAGLAFAVALDRAGGGELAITVAGPDPVDRLTRDGPRAFALSAASKAMLDALGIWQELESSTQPVRTIELTDTPLEAGVRPVLLTYDNHLPNGEPASYIVPAHCLGAALVSAVSRATGVSLQTDWEPGDFASHATHASVGAIAGAPANARLIISADGRNSQLRKSAGVETVDWCHHQTGIVTMVRHELAHEGRAVQHFLPGGPFAILPLPGNHCCITWSEDREVADRILALDEPEFLAEVDRRFGGKLGELSLAGGRAAFPLATRLARSFIAPRFAVIGDAAHSVHPIAGQGLNLALRDVAALCECLLDGARVGLDIGDFTLLERYERWRRFDSVVSAGSYGGINKVFGADHPLLRSMREVALGAVDRLPGLKAFLVAEAAGQTGEMPKFLLGQLP